MQGYLTLATGSALYFEAAANLALSVKLNDPSRPISLLCDRAGKLPSRFRPFFDQVIELPAHPQYAGCGDKIRAPLYSPYEETMFLDSDCFIAIADMDRHWEKMGRGFWGMPGGKVSQGTWYGNPIEKMMEQENVPYVIKMNSGVFWFKAGPQLDAFIREATKIVEEGSSQILVGHRGDHRQVADEPIWGVLMARYGVEPIKYTASEGSVSVSTYLARGISINPLTGQSRLKKSTGFKLMGRYWSRGWVDHSPTLPHFVAFKPRRSYRKAANGLRQHFGQPPFDFPKD